MYLKQEWQASGLQGAYNDDYLKLVGPSEYVLMAGGSLIEYPAFLINSTEIIMEYQAAFAAMLITIRNHTKQNNGEDSWITANVSGENLFMSLQKRALLSALNALLREDYLTATTGLTGYFGLQKAWDSFALAHAGIRSIIQCQLKNGRATYLGKGVKEHWEWDQESCLAQFLLLQTPGLTYFQAWGNGFTYGSSNTGTWNYYKAGVPMNMAYQPTDMLDLIDIGVPLEDQSVAIPPSKDPMQWMVRTKVPLSDYTILGNTTSTILKHDEIADEGVLPLRPSFIYYAQRNAYQNNPLGATPSDAVLARRYTKGLVLYRTNTYGGSTEFMASNSTTVVELGPDLYHRVTRTGTLSPPLSSVALRGYEGAILLLAPSPSPTQTPAASPSALPSQSPTASLSVSSSALLSRSSSTSTTSSPLSSLSISPTVTSSSSSTSAASIPSSDFSSHAYSFKHSNSLLILMAAGVQSIFVWVFLIA